jgi:ABC-type branched-subunit amino acid transport system substrate-binding protein
VTIRLVLSMLMMVACVVRQPSTSAPDLIQRAQGLAQSDRIAAIQLLEDYLQGGTTAEVEPWAMLWAGEHRRLSADLPTARQWFERLAERYPTHTLKDGAILGMALVDAEHALSGNTIATLQLMRSQAAPDSMNADRYRILALVGAQEGSPAAKVKENVRRALAFAKSDITVEARVLVSLQGLIEHAEAVQIQNENPITGSPEEVGVKRARAALSEGRVEDAAARAQDVLDTWPASAHTMELEYIIKRAAAGNPTKAKRVGILLPLSGAYAPAAQHLKQVIKLANESEGAPLELMFADTAGTAEQTIHQIESLVIEHGCVAIMGPLLKENGEIAAQRAQALRTPMVALTQGGDPASVGSFVFRGFLPLDQQVDALLDHAMNQVGHTRFAVLHPYNGYGEKARDLFTAAVTQRGGTVTRVHGYDTDTTDFRKMARALGRTDGDDRHGELVELRAAAKRRGEDPTKVALPPTIDFDAIFIPDNHRRLALVISALAYEEFPVGTFRRHVEDRPIQLLGLNAWNDPKIVQTGGKYIFNSVFVDAFHVGSKAPTITRFVGRFQDAFGRNPRVVDGLAWDATRLTIAAVRDGQNNRQAIRDALTREEIDGPVAGGSKFGPNREVDRVFHVLTVTETGIRTWLDGGGPTEPIPE